jgi:hypothetical protein
MTNKAYKPSSDLKPAQILPYHLREKSLWDREERTIDVTKYNRFLKDRIEQVRKELAAADKKKADLEWRKDFILEQKVLRHRRDNNILQDD